jgi:hypothetical protein
LAGGAIMAKIISGGLIGSSAARTQPNYTPQTQQQSQPESWGGYAARNAGGAGEGFLKGLEALGSLFTPSQEHQQQQRQSQIEGLQRVNRMLQERGDQPFTNFPTNEQQLKQTLPSDIYLGALNKGESFGPSKNITESALRFGLTEAPFIAASGGFSSLPSFGKAAAGSLGMLAGSQAGHAIGEQIGGEKGGIVGGLAGGLGGSFLTHGILNRPSKAYNKFKQAELEGTKIDYEGLGAEHKARLQNAVQVRNKGIEQLAQDKLLRDAKIKDLAESRTPLYNQATKAMADIKEPAVKFNNLIEDIGENVRRGVEKSDRLRVYDMLNEVESHIEGGQLSLKDAVQMQKNLNTKLAKAKAFGAEALPNVVESKYKQVVKGLNDFIEEVGNKHPEFGKPWTEAEAKTREYKTLLKENKEFNKQQNLDLRELKSDFKETSKNLDTGFKDSLKQEKLVKAIEFAGEGVKNWGLGFLGAAINKGLGGNTLTSGLAGLGIKLGQEFVRETKLMNAIMKEHPALYKEYVSALKHYMKTEAPKSLTKIKEITKRATTLAQKEDKHHKKSRIISGGLK